jgi:dihydroneopterin aldolase
MTRLEVRDLSVPVRLGCSAEERAVPQEARFSLTLELPRPPRACQTDRLEDTICYATICDAIRAVATSGEFATVERLGAAALERLRAALPPDVRARLRVHKVRPPVEDLLGGAIFELESP